MSGGHLWDLWDFCGISKSDWEEGDSKDWRGQSWEGGGGEIYLECVEFELFAGPHRESLRFFIHFTNIH